MKINNIHLSYYVNNTLKEISSNFLESIENDDIKFMPEVSKVDKGYILNIKLKNKKEITLENFLIDYTLDLKNKNMLVNGYQSWSESMEMNKNGELKPLSSIVKGRMEPYGDYLFYKYKGQKGVFHSHTFTYFRNSKEQDQHILFLGSCDEKSGYTIFEGNLKNNKLIIMKDCRGFLIDGEKSILKLYIEEGEEKTIWKKYCSFFKGNREAVSMCTGWTSWYNYYTKISQDIVLENLENIKKENIPLDVFQIDDGYQTAVGDWLSINEKFPLGMNFLAYKIKTFGYKPGIWLTPFICEKDSKIFKEHKEWLVKDDKGKPLAAGWNSEWSGKFYALDFYNLEFRAYLAKVFHTIINIWGYEMLKLDFLYAAALIPRKGKTRGAIMQDAVDFLNDIIGDKLILASGVPLGNAFKKVDYCRIGADVTPYWENSKQKLLKYRERVSTVSSIHSALARFRVNGEVFYNAPDVFMLKKEDNKMNEEQKYSLFILNNLLGGLLALSDDISKYDENEMELFKSMFPKIRADIHYIKNKKDTYEISFNIEDKGYIVLSNLTGSQVKMKLPQGEYFNKKDFVVKGNTNIKLKPYETKCFYKIETEKDFYLVGTTGHLFPVSEINLLEEKEGQINIEINSKFINKGDIYLKILNDDMDIFINGEKYDSILQKGYKVVRYI
ncbi:glycoside hydrolase family 36 protein [Clostridium ganghwense]|uniref:Alpha-galactosidase n=1 Tax=Clostridium ganghwense TaxID=312089 RepID=A0ABT4CSN0_9CLOT|nr:glycoside hydrolase family 36 protein [Clostridium ganghwense]MCY6371428.1 alpha-galactosidase [Clostridium ganghwense]